MTTPLTPPTDVVARLTAFADAMHGPLGLFPRDESDERVYLYPADLRALLAAYADAARDRERMDWLEQSGLVLSCQDSEQEDGSDVAVWMLGPDLDASNALWVGPTARAVIDAARTGEAR